MEHIKALLAKAVELELMISELYELFQSTSVKNNTFWWLLSREEKNHASLLKKTEQLITQEIFPQKLLLDNLSSMNKAVQELSDALVKFRKNPPDDEQAARFALDLENKNFEIHYQLVMNEKPDTEIMKRLKTINFADKNHADRISEHLNLKEQT